VFLVLGTQHCWRFLRNVKMNVTEHSLVNVKGMNRWMELKHRSIGYVGQAAWIGNLPCTMRRLPPAAFHHICIWLSTVFAWSLQRAACSCILYSLSALGFRLSAVFVFAFQLYLREACSVQLVAVFCIRFQLSTLPPMQHSGPNTSLLSWMNNLQ
jgi:hypothetical protein